MRSGPCSLLLSTHRGEPTNKQLNYNEGRTVLRLQQNAKDAQRRKETDNTEDSKPGPNAGGQVWMIPAEEASSAKRGKASLQPAMAWFLSWRLMGQGEEKGH